MHIVWSQAAFADFEQAVSYIAEQDGTAARHVAERIDVAVRKLATVRTGRPGRVTGTYEKSVSRTPYVLAYAVTDDTITILRVIHSRRNWREEDWPA